MLLGISLVTNSNGLYEDIALILENKAPGNINAIRAYIFGLIGGELSLLVSLGCIART